VRAEKIKFTKVQLKFLFRLRRGDKKERERERIKPPMAFEKTRSVAGKKDSGFPGEERKEASIGASSPKLGQVV